MAATAAKDSKPLGIFRMDFAVGANGCATGGKCGKEGNDGVIGMTCTVGVGCDISICGLLFSVFSSVLVM